MKKIFSLMAAVLLAGTVLAQGALTFTFTDSEDEQGVVTITPSDPEALYVWGFYSDGIGTIVGLGSLEEMAMATFQLTIQSEEDCSKGETVADLAEWMLGLFDSAPTNGTYTLWVAAAVLITENEVTSVVPASDLFTHEVTIGEEVQDFAGKVVLGESSFTVTGLADGETFVAYVVSEEFYGTRSPYFGDVKILGDLLADLASANIFFTEGTEVAYDDDRLSDFQYDGANNYFILVAGAERGTDADGAPDVVLTTNPTKVALTLDEDGKRVESTTALETVQADGKAVKTVRDGQVIIIRDGKQFNVLGAQMD